MPNVEFARPFIKSTNEMMVRSDLSRATANTCLMWLVVIVAGLVPFALGGNRPMIWALTLAVLSAAGLVYFLTILALRVNLAASVTDMPVRLGLFCAFLAFCLFQTLPVAFLLPASLVYLPPGLPSFAAISISPGDTLMALVTWLNIALIAFFAMQVGGNEQRSFRLVSLLFWLSVFHAVVAFVMFHEFDDSILFMRKWAYEGSMTGGFVNRNTFGTFLATGVALGTAVISKVLNAPRRTGWQLLSIRGGVVLPLLGVFVLLAALISTTSRMALFVGVLGIVVVLLLTGLKRQERGSVWSRLLVFLGLVVSAGVLLLLYGSTTLERLGSVESSVDYRFDLYRQVWNMITLRPLTGYGGGTFELSFALFHQPPVSVEWIWQKAHNTYLGLLVDYGVVFGSLPTIVLLLTLLLLFRTYLRAPNPDYTAIATIAVIVVASVHALVDFSLEIQGYALYFAAVVGAGTAKTVAVRSPERISR